MTSWPYTSRELRFNGRILTIVWPGRRYLDGRLIPGKRSMRQALKRYDAQRREE